MKKETKKDKKQQSDIPRPSMATTVEPHARYQEIMKELAQVRLDKKKKF